MQRDFYSQYFELEDDHWWFKGRRQVIARLLDELPAPAVGHERELIDVGCGTGGMFPLLARYGRVRAVDADEEAIRFCHMRGLHDVQLVPVDASHLPFDDMSCDVITAFDVLEHVDDHEGLLREMRRVVRPGGHLVVTVPAFPSLWGPQDVISHHKRRYRARTLRDVIARAGYETVRLTHFNTLLFPPIAVIRLLGRLRRPKTVEEVRSDLELTPPGGPVNAILSRILGAEAILIERRDLPIGVSIAAIARRRD